MTDARTVVIVGASLAGLRTAETLRTEGFDGTVVLVGAESHLPYDRPPLSKQLLAGEWEPDRIALRKADVYADLAIDVELGRRASALDVEARRVTLDDRRMLSYDALVIATGASCRRLPNQPKLEGIFELRSLDDALALRTAMSTGSPAVVVIGAGFIGSEVAATARERGLAVTVLEALPAPLVRGLGTTMGNAVGQLHVDHGVQLRCGVHVAGFVGTDRVEGVALADGSVIAADIVVVGVGVRPATEWLDGSGLIIDDGVVCDATLAASAPGVWAAGDVARWHHGNELMRIEHWTNANEQGAHAAQNVLARFAGAAGTAFETVPFVWSEQYGSRISVVGRVGGEDEVKLVHGSLDERKWVAIYGRAGRLRGAVGLDLPKQLMAYRKLLLRNATWVDALEHAAAK